MRLNSMRQWQMLALLAVVSSMAVAAPAAAQLQGDLHYASGYTLVPDRRSQAGPRRCSFAAWEQPTLLVSELRASFRSLRSNVAATR